MQCLRPVQPDDFGMDFEEDDFDEVEQLEELEAEAVARDDDDIEALKGPVSSISDNYSGRPGGTLRTDEDIQIVLDKTQVRSKLFCLYGLKKKPIPAIYLGYQIHIWVKETY